MRSQAPLELTVMSKEPKDVRRGEKQHKGRAREKEE